MGSPTYSTLSSGFQPSCRFILASNSRASSLVNAFARESMGMECFMVPKAAKGLSPTLCVGESAVMRCGNSASIAWSLLKSRSYSASVTTGLSRT